MQGSTSGSEATADDADAETLFSVRNLTTYYDDGRLLGGDPVRAVDGVSLEFRRGETLGLVGESGCGKTTLGRTILGLEEATDGEVVVDGTDVTAVSAERRREWQREAQMVFQDPDGSLNDRMTVGAIIREPLDAHGWKTPADRRERVFDFMDRVGLREEHFYRYPHQFSGGQKQRIGIARALVLEPAFVVLDEPVSALDVSVQAQVINLLEDLQDDLGLTYLFIAHDLSVVRHIADRVAVMYLGNIVEVGPTERVFEDPAHPYTESLLSAIPGDRARGGAGGGRSRIALRGAPPDPRDPPPGCPFATRCPAKIRPEGFDMDEAAWRAIEEFRAALRERAAAEGTLGALVRGALGFGSDPEIKAFREDLFGGVDLPEDAAERVDAATEAATAGRNREAATLLREAFGSACDREYPSMYRTDGEPQESRCLRHDPDHEPPGPVIEARTGGE